MRKSSTAGKSTWVDPDDAPELTDEFFENAEVRENGVLIRPGRPRSTNPKQQVTVRLDPDVLAKLRESGPGWQTRINDILRQAVMAAGPVTLDERMGDGA